MKLNKKILFVLSIFTLTLSSCEKVTTYEPKDYMIDIDFKSDFKILQLSDIHLGQKDDLDRHFKFLDLTIKDANPDFIMITGDLFTFANRRTMNSVFDFFDSYKIPWSVTWGNHDEQCDFSISYMTGELNKRCNSGDSYCKFIDRQDDDVFGYANFVINLKQGNINKFQLFSIDSNRYYYGDYMGYDYIHQDQIEWYEKMVNYSTLENSGAVIPSLAFFHIPLPEFDYAWNHKEDDPDVVWNGGENREKVCCPEINTGLFDKMYELGSTKGIFVGHDHINNADLTYKGIRLVYTTKSTDRIYADDDIMGGLTITIHDDCTFDVKRLPHTYEEIGK